MKIVSSERLIEEYLGVNSCGRQYIAGERQGSLREKGRMDYHLLYIAEGWAEITENGRKQKVPAGSVIFYPPHVRQEYCFYEETNSVSYYIHFGGTECEKLMRSIGVLEERIVFIGKSAEIENCFLELIEEYNMKEILSDAALNGKLLTLLAGIGRRLSYRRAGIDNASGSRIKEIKRQMSRELTENITLSEYAGRCGLSESRFAHLFKEMTDMSPHRYLLFLRCEKARELLENTEMSMAQVAEQVGIADQNYFSRFFKKYTGQSPREYRHKERLQKNNGKKI